MEVIIHSIPTLANLAAEAICQVLHTKPAAVLGLATGSSPIVIYDELIARYRAGIVDFSAAQAFTLDEYVGIDPNHPQRYRNVIMDVFAKHVNFGPGRVHSPNGNAPDLARACVDYEDEIHRSGGIDVQILGVGTDGHIAFNEPGSSLSSRTRLKSLTAQTRADNARFFDGDIDQVPRHCLTQGLATIMAGKHVIVIASGRGKAQAVHQMVEGPVSALWPASVLQFHPHVSVLVDDNAASRLQLADYYRETYRHKPTWQQL